MKKKVKILLVDDDADDFVITRDLLSEIQNFDVELDWVDSYDLGLEAVRQQRHDVYLLDYRLGAHTGLQLLTEAIKDNCKSPIILLTGSDDREIDMQAMNAGAADYLVKGQIDEALLERCIRYSLEQRRVLNALQESEEKYRRIIEGTAAIVVSTDCDGNVLYINETGLAVLGYTQAELIGAPFFRWVDPRDQAHTEAVFREQVAVGQGRCATEFRYRTKAGETGWFSSLSRLVKDEAGIQGLNSVLQDITEKKRTEEELTNAREREIDTAARIQELLLLGKAPEDVVGLKIAAMTIASQKVDGDFIDFIRHQDRVVDVVVGDVMGKGVPAALLAAATKSKMLRTLHDFHVAGSEQKVVEPYEFVARLHGEFCGQLIGLERFITLCYARFDTRRGSVELVDCGHTKTIHFRQGFGECKFLEGNNLPLGCVENESYEQVSVGTEPGDIFLFYSDGVTEARNGMGDFFGQTRLADIVARFYFLSPEELLGRLRQEVVQFCGAEVFADDLTFVAVKIADEANSSLPRSRTLEIRSQLAELARARLFIRQFCPNDTSAHREALTETFEQLELAVHEALTNIMEHAYHKREDGTIRLVVEPHPQDIVVHLFHEGDHFTPETVQPPNIDNYPEHGYGLYIIDQCVDNVRYTQNPSGKNCISLTKRLPEAPSQ